MKQSYQEIMESVKSYFDLNHNATNGQFETVTVKMPATKVESEKKKAMIPCTLSCSYDAFGNILYRNEQGQLHNPNEPAVMGSTTRYFLNDKEYSLSEWEKEVERIRLKADMKELIKKKNDELLQLIKDFDNLS